MVARDTATDRAWPGAYSKDCPPHSVLGPAGRVLPGPWRFTLPRPSRYQQAASMTWADLVMKWQALAARQAHSKTGKRVYMLLKLTGGHHE